MSNIVSRVHIISNARAKKDVSVRRQILVVRRVLDVRKSNLRYNAAARRCHVVSGSAELAARGLKWEGNYLDYSGRRLPLWL